MPKKAQTTTQLLSFHLLARWWSESFKLDFNSTWAESFQTVKLELAAEQPSTREFWYPPKKKKTLWPRTKEKPQQDGRMGMIMFKIKPHMHQKCSEDTNKTLCVQGPRDLSHVKGSQVTPAWDWARPGSGLSVWGSPVEVRVSSSLPWRQRLWNSSLGRCSVTQVLLKEVAMSSTPEPLDRRLTNRRAITPKKVSRSCRRSRAHNRLPNLGIRQKDWVSLRNLTLKVSRIWLQTFLRTGETDSWRAQTKPWAHQDQEKGAVTPQETEPDLPVSVQESLVDGSTVACQVVRGTDYNSPGRPGMLAQVLLKEFAITAISPTIIWLEGYREGGRGTQPQPSAGTWIKDLLSMAPPTRARLNFPQSQCLPSGSLH